MRSIKILSHTLLLLSIVNSSVFAREIGVEQLCKKVGTKLSSVSIKDCQRLKFDTPRFYSVNGLPLLEKRYPASKSRKYAPKILFIGGIHGDEYSSVSVTFKWLKTLDKYHSGAYDWHFLPLANPDGLLRKESTRVNAREIDLNRNFVTGERDITAIEHWREKTKRRARYFPGNHPLSEPESDAIHQLIKEIEPTVIVSVHAPHGILDFDGKVRPPSQLGPLHLRQLGTYPGSLGNYGYHLKNIPVMTIELKHAGIMPKKQEISAMWMDLVRWIKVKTKSKEIAVLMHDE